MICTKIGHIILSDGLTAGECETCKRLRQADKRVYEASHDRDAAMKAFDKMKAERDRYREALEYYARCYNCDSITRACTADHQIAREALEGK